MANPMFKGVKDEDPESFIRHYKRTYLSMESRTTEN